MIGWARVTWPSERELERWEQGILKGGWKYHCTIDLLFDWFGISCMTTDNFCFYLQNRLFQTSQTGGQRYSDTSPFSIPCWDPCCPTGDRNWQLIWPNCKARGSWKIIFNNVIKVQNLYFTKSKVLLIDKCWFSNLKTHVTLLVARVNAP